MKFSSQVLAGAIAVLLSSAAFAQSSAPSTDAPSKEQLRAEMRADKVANHALAKKVEQAIYHTKGLNDTDIAVFAKARTGKVILAGMIMEESQDQLAQDVASKVPGVQSVTSKLTIYEAP